MKRALVAVVTAVTLLLAACGDDDASSTASETDESVRPEMAQDQELSAADQRFAAAMLPHHGQALEMAELASSRAGSDAVRDLADRIRAAQGPEIAQLREWLAADGSSGSHSGSTAQTQGSGGHDGDGMMTADDLAALEQANGAAFDELFLTQMIEHHEGAVAMAESQVAEGQHREVVDMAEAIVETQQDEIAEMRSLLAGDG